MWKAVLGYLWGWKVIPLLFVAIVSTFWFFDPSNYYYHNGFTGLIAVVSVGLTIYESAVVVSKVTRK